MRRKDGQKKRKARRTLPSYTIGLRTKQQQTGVYAPAGRSTSGTFSLLSLFAGCGGLDLGFEGGFSVYGRRFHRHPIETIAAYDILDDAVAAYRLNLGDGIEQADLKATRPSMLPSCDILAGGFPCQDFSSSGPKVGLSGKRGALYTIIRDYLGVHQPPIVVGENVPYLARLENGRYLRTILQEFEETGYRFRVWSLVGPEFGLPQSRERLFLIGVRDDLDGFPRMPTPSHLSCPFTIDQALDDLESVHDETICNQSQYFVATKATAGGGQGDHKNRKGSFAYCIRANARGRIQFHHHLDRRLTVRECARLQSFPDDFVFPFTTQRNMTLIGNAVPPLLAHAVADSLVAFLSGGGAAPKGAVFGMRSKELLSHRHGEHPLFPALETV